jgi:hypothetical protein
LLFSLDCTSEISGDPNMGSWLFQVTVLALGCNLTYIYAENSDRRCHLDALFLLNIFSGSIFCPTLVETVGLRVSNRDFRDFKLFHVDFSRRKCPSARWASAANGISRNICTLNCRPVLINDLLPGLRV